MKRLENRVAIVTGGASGLGEATVQRLAEEGAAVVVADIDHAGAEAVAKAVVDQGGRATPAKLDVRDRAAVEQLVATTFATYGRLDVMHNNAGIAPLLPMALLDDDAIAEVIDVNLKGVIHGVAAAGKAMLEAGTPGSIINTASISALGGQAMTTLYAATKGAVVSLTRSAACEFAPLVRVNAIAPGGIRTPIIEKILGGTPGPEVSAALDRMHLLGRMGRPEEIAAAVAFLASDDASFMTGTLLTVDGGLTATLPLDLASAMRG